MNKPVYDSIGVGYTQHRQADERIVDALYSLLNLPPDSVVADIGAGTGNYSIALANKGYRIKAIEPSTAMRIQSLETDRVEWVSGYAENIPLDTASVDGVVVVLAIHHFTSINVAANEMHRICPKGPVVIFTTDPRESEEFWYADYFPEICKQDYQSFPPIDIVIQDITTGKG